MLTLRICRVQHFLPHATKLGFFFEPERFTTTLFSLPSLYVLRSTIYLWGIRLSRDAQLTPLEPVFATRALRSVHDALSAAQEQSQNALYVLQAEIHFAEDPPERNMRHARRFERKRSPLVQLEWWRICLDEAQMVESGVTTAARVACRLPRVHSWAVSGTPVRKNIEDLHGLLIFLRYRPLASNIKLWRHIVSRQPGLFRLIFANIALRHTKAQIRDELHLPPQKRVVLTMPFTAVEQQHYSTLFSDKRRPLRTDFTRLNCGTRFFILLPLIVLPQEKSVPEFCSSEG